MRITRADGATTTMYVEGHPLRFESGTATVEDPRLAARLRDPSILTAFQLTIDDPEPETTPPDHWEA